MIIYQSIDLRTEQNDLSRFAIKLARHLLSHARLLSSQMESEAVHLLLEEAPRLMAFDLYNKELGEEAFEVILKTAAQLESKRREQNNPSLEEIQVCLLVKSFPRDILLRIPSGLAEIRLFEWSLIRTEANDAILLRELTKGITQDKMMNHAHQSELLECSTQLNPLKQELSTPELVAFARLGMELRSHRS